MDVNRRFGRAQRQRSCCGGLRVGALCPKPYWVASLLDGVRVVQPESIEDLGYLEIPSLASGLHEVVDSRSVACERRLLRRKVVLSENVRCTSLWILIGVTFLN